VRSTVPLPPATPGIHGRPPNGAQVTRRAAVLGVQTLTVERARGAIRGFTPVPAREVVELGRGTDSVAFLVDGEWVFRFPVVPNAQRTLRRELALLPRLRRALPLAAPGVEHAGRRDGRLVFAGYRCLPGVPLTADLFAGLTPDAQEAALADIAGFLTALHAYPAAAARAAGVAEELLTGGYDPQQRELHRRLGDLLTAREVARLDAMFDDYERDHEPGRGAPVLLHSDLKPEHVLYDSAARRVAGILDWGDVSLGDGDFDLAVISIFFGEGFLRRLLPHLPDRDADTVLSKARFFTTLRALQDVVYDLQLGDRRALDEGLAGLRDQLGTA
jgi:aminoglycoside 2''-phosphotransferase